MPGYIYFESTRYSYRSSDKSAEDRRRSYQDEYDWFEDLCEELGAEPELYDD